MEEGWGHHETSPSTISAAGSGCRRVANDPKYRQRASLSRQAGAFGGRLCGRGCERYRVGEIRDTLDAIRNTGAATIIVQPSPFTYQQRDRVIAGATDDHLATVYAFPAAAREGSLIAYGPDYLHMHQRAPFYVDRVLKGTKPADLPVEQPTKFELVVNIRSAKLLGLEVPLTLLVTADELIE